MAKKLVKLAGSLFVDFNSGDLYMKYGSGGWFETKIGTIKGTDALVKVKETYGKKEGQKVRLAVARAIMTKGKWSIEK